MARGPFVDYSAENHLIRKYISRLRVRTPSFEQRAGLLSGGSQQKVLLAKWLAVQPTVLTVDEPTRGVDIGTKAEIYALFDELVREGIAILVISSDLPEVLALADRTFVDAPRRIARERVRSASRLNLNSEVGESSSSRESTIRRTEQNNCSTIGSFPAQNANAPRTSTTTRMRTIPKLRNLGLNALRPLWTCPPSHQPPPLFRRLRLFRRQHERIGKIINVFIHHEGGDCIVKRLLEGCWSSFAVNTARNRLVLCK